MTKNEMELVVITGMSGAGKTVALQSFEDMGYFCIDNLPPSLFQPFWELMENAEDIDKVCLVIDLRSRELFNKLEAVISQLEQVTETRVHIVFLEASVSKLVSRYKESRRSHPLQVDGRSTLQAIEREKEKLAPIKAKSQLIIDTSLLSPRELRQSLMREFHQSSSDLFSVDVLSFGFKYGIPIDSDIVIDVRFLPNPFYMPDLRPQTGKDPSVYDYVMSQSETEIFYQKFVDLLDFTLPRYQQEGKSSVTIAIGCTGGQHRSVALVERIGAHIKEKGFNTHISHRDMIKSQQAVKLR